MALSWGRMGGSRGLLLALALLARTPACPAGWQAFESSCFRVFEGPANWDQARERCEGLGAQLASVHSEAENGQLVFACGNTRPYHQGCWLGGTDRNQRYRKWIWVDGAAFKWSKWFDHGGGNLEPNNDFCTDHRHCTYGHTADCNVLEVGENAYADSKRALMLWTSVRAQSLAFKGGLFCFAATPGMVDTELSRYSMSPWLWPLTKPLRMVLLRHVSEGALAVAGGALKPQATNCFGRYMDGEVQLEDLVIERMGEKPLAAALVKWATQASALEQRAAGYER
ncbi:unnamed protein product [Effrenium voratum]|nr:unnamed protein product [Effrenium voratum]